MQLLKKHCLAACLLTLSLTLSNATNAADKQWLAFAPSELTATLKPLAQRRREQGWQTQVTAWNKSAQDLRTEIARRAKSFPGQTVVVLCGAYGVTKNASTIQPLRGTRGRMAGRRTDYAFGLPDEHGVAQVAVGRLPARNALELKGMVQKIIRFEDQPVGPWSQRITLIVADPGGASAVERQFAELIVQSALGRRIETLHPRWRLSCVADAKASHFAVAHEKFGTETQAMFSNGQFLSCYVGHSSSAGLASGRQYVMQRDDFQKLKIKNSSGIFFSCGCFGAQITGRSGQGYLLSAVQNPTGPVATIGAYAESYAAPGQLALDGLMNAVNHTQQKQTLGEYWLAVQNGLAHGKIGGLTFWLYDQADGTRGAIKLPNQRKEHLEMWTLLGDPGLQLPNLKDEKLQIVGDVKPGETIQVSMPAVDVGDNSSATVSLEYRFQRSADPAKALATKNIPLSDKPFQTKFLLPEFDKRRAVIVRVVIAGDRKRVQGTRLTKRSLKR